MKSEGLLTLQDGKTLHWSMSTGIGASKKLASVRAKIQACDPHRACAGRFSAEMLRSAWELLNAH